jgi:cytochrome c
MFDTMTITKAVGSVCGSLLVFLLAGWAAESLYTVGHTGGHGEGEEIAQAYSIDTGAEEAPAESEEPAVDFATLLASADAGAGETVFRKCSACHKLDGTDGVGPHLNGVVGRNHAAVEGFAYSEANIALSAEVWTPEAISSFVENPKGYMPGTKMNFPGLPDAEDRANLVAYLSSVP